MRQSSFDAEDVVATLPRNVCNYEPTLRNMAEGEYWSADREMLNEEILSGCGNETNIYT
jgi:hypothetical protein